MTHHDEDYEDDFYASGNVRDDPPPHARPGSNSGLDEDDAIDGMELDDLLKESRKALLVGLLKAVKGGYATPPEMAVLARILKDNGCVMGDPSEGAGSDQGEKADLPTFSRPEYT
jgi:hypothetical protein